MYGDDDDNDAGESSLILAGSYIFWAGYFDPDFKN
jgi:hypothetical protein